MSKGAKEQRSKGTISLVYKFKHWLGLLDIGLSSQACLICSLLHRLYRTICRLSAQGMSGHVADCGSPLKWFEPFRNGETPWNDENKQRTRWIVELVEFPSRAFASRSIPGSVGRQSSCRKLANEANKLLSSCQQILHAEKGLSMLLPFSAPQVFGVDGANASSPTAKWSSSPKGAARAGGGPAVWGTHRTASEPSGPTQQKPK